jgi:hypothetical protein
MERPSRRPPNRGNVVEDPLGDRIADGGHPECQGQVATRLSRSPIAPARSLLRQEDQFVPPKLSARSAIRKQTVAATRGNGRDAPKAVISRGRSHVAAGFPPSELRQLFPLARTVRPPANTTWAYEHSPFGQNADADYCQGIAKIDPCWVSDSMSSSHPTTRPDLSAQAHASPS